MFVSNVSVKRIKLFISGFNGEEYIPEEWMKDLLDQGLLEKRGNSTIFIAGSFKSQLIDYSDLPGGYGERLEGSIWQLYDN